MMAVYCILFFWLVKMISPKVKDEWNIPVRASDFQMIRQIYNMQVRIVVFHNTKPSPNFSHKFSSTCQRGVINYDDNGQNIK